MLVGHIQATLSKCTLTGNSATQNGGGVYHGTLNNCTLTGNSAGGGWPGGGGGGAYLAALSDCKLASNGCAFAALVAGHTVAL